MQSKVGVLVEMVTHVAFFVLVIAFAYLAALASEPSVNGDGESGVEIDGTIGGAL